MYIGVDCGTQSTKVVVVDVEGGRILTALVERLGGAAGGLVRALPRRPSRGPLHTAGPPR